MKLPAVTAIVPVWNRCDLLEKLLAGLSAQTHAPAEILAVDNGSEDGSAELAGARGARVIRMGRNAGFSAAVNRGVREASTDWVAILNNDVELEPEWLERLLERAAGSAAWFATGKILAASRRDRIDATWDALCRGGCAWRIGSGRRDGELFSNSRVISLAPLTAALLRREVFERAGYLDESFESYLEDVEFGLRCARAGLEGCYVPEAVAYHVGSATLGRWHPDSVRRIARNQVFIVSRHYSSRLLLRYALPIVVAQALWGAVALRHGAGWAWLRGKTSGLRQFRAMRRAGDDDAERVAAVLENGERDILHVQRSTGFDFFWRAYFLLTGGAD
jgi:GT2 family glycosyltransferase